MHSRLKFFLYPFACLYGLITFLRNKLYDFKILKSYEIPVKSIIVGNLSVGGTGKTPYVLLIANYFSNKKVAVLSRGYGRGTKGFILVDNDQNAAQVGDEPYLFTTRLNSNCTVAVCENRSVGVKKLLEIEPEIELIILDDAFQHRQIKAGFSIVLSDFNFPFFKDYMLPMGYLREWKLGLKRADILVYTKCPKSLNQKQKQHFIGKVDMNVNSVYFSSIKYDVLTPINTTVSPIKNILLVAGIANPTPLIEELSKNYFLETVIFPDHYVFNEIDLTEIHRKFDTFALEDKIILTTEKDVVRLLPYLQTNQGKSYPWYTIPITINIENELEFFNELENYVGKI